MKPKTSCLVISLAADTERRAVFEEQAKKAGISWQFFDAHTSPQNGLVYQDEEALVRRGRPLSKAEIGCFSSHYGTWCHFLASDADQLIVLEDDVIADWSFLGVVAERDFASHEIHYLRLSSKAPAPYVLRGEFLGRYLAHYLGYALGSQAYLLTRAAAQRFVKRHTIVHAPIDDVLDQTWWGGLPTYGIYHPPVIEANGPSRIGTARDTGAPMTPRIKLRRLRFRIEEKIRSRGYRLWSRMFPPSLKGIDSRWI